MKLKCFKHPKRNAIAVMDKKYPMCQECTTQSQFEVLQRRGRFGVAVQGDLKGIIVAVDNN